MQQPGLTIPRIYEAASEEGRTGQSAGKCACDSQPCADALKHVILCIMDAWIGSNGFPRQSTSKLFDLRIPLTRDSYPATK